MIEIIVLIFLLVFFVLASYEDIKKREVYDYLNFSLVFIILIISIIDSLISNSFDPIKFVIFGLLVGFAFGSLLYYLGVWGGGDAKFMLGFGASSYYIINFVGPFTSVSNFYENLVSYYGVFIDLALEYFLWFILILDGIFLFFVVLSFLFSKPDRKRGIDLLLLGLILSLLFSGIYFNLSPFILFLFGFLAFILIFFGDELLFNSVYLVLKKSSKYFEKGDILNKDLLVDGKVLVKQENTNFGLVSEDFRKIKELKSSFFVEVRKILPFGSLIALNYFLYTIKIVSISTFTFDLFFFILVFLLISFLVGGIFSFLLIFIVYILNLKKIKLSLNKFEFLFLVFLFLCAGLLSFFNQNFFILFSLPLLYLFVKLAKSTEKYLFVKPKEIEKIVPGDWIVESVKIGEKIYFDVEDFKLGVDEHQLKKINSLAKENKNFKSLLVKDGIAFLPPLFVGFLILLFFF